MLQESTVSHRAVCAIGKLSKVEMSMRPPVQGLDRQRSMTRLDGAAICCGSRSENPGRLHLQNVSLPRHHLVEHWVHEEAQE